MSNSKNSRRKRLVGVGALCLLPFLLVGWYFWSNADRSPDRYGVLTAMIKVQFSNQKIVSVNGQSDVLLAGSELGENKTLNTYMKHLGWKFVNRGGSTSYFRKADQAIQVTHLAMTRYFTLHILKPER